MMKGQKVILHYQGLFGHTVARMEARLIERKTYGFNTACGAWCLYQLDPTDEPAEFIIYVLKGKKKTQSMNARDVMVEEVGE